MKHFAEGKDRGQSTLRPERLNQSFNGANL